MPDFQPHPSYGFLTHEEFKTLQEPAFRPEAKERHRTILRRAAARKGAFLRQQRQQEKGAAHAS